MTSPIKAHPLVSSRTSSKETSRSLSDRLGTLPPLLTPILRWIAIGSFGVIVSLSCATSLLAESWTDLRGTRTIEARMIGVWDDTVVLEMSGGKRVSVKLGTLRSDSRIQARNIAKRMQEQRAEQVSELKAQRMVAAAPAPDPLPTPREAPPYQAPKANLEIGDFLANFDESILDGHLVVLYDSLPPKYRTDVDEVVKLAANNMDRENWVKVTSTLQQLGDVLVQKQNWVASSPRVSSSGPATIEAVEGPLIGLADALRVGLSHSSFSLDKIQSTPFGNWLRELDPVLAPHLAKIQDESGSLKTRTVEVKKSDKATATVEFTVGDIKSTQRFENVEGFWVPTDYARGWDKMIAGLKTQYGEGSASDPLDTYVPMVEQLSAFVGPLRSADDAGSFHDAIETAIEPVTMLADTFGPMLAIQDSGPSMSYDQGGYGRGGQSEADARAAYDEQQMAEQMEQGRGGS